MNLRGFRSRTGTVSLVSLALMLAGATAMAVSARGERPALDSAAMLSATVTVETVSHVRIDHIGDSVWTQGNGSGVLVSTERCEVWTNHHVVDDAAFVEIRMHDGDTSSHHTGTRGGLTPGARRGSARTRALRGHRRSSAWRFRSRPHRRRGFRRRQSLRSQPALVNARHRLARTTLSGQRLALPANRCSHWPRQLRRPPVQRELAKSLD